MADWKCPKCGHVLGQFNLINSGAVTAAAQTVTILDAPYGRCADCGVNLPPPNAAAHQCWGAK